MIDRFAHLILAVQWNFIKAITILSGSILRHTGTFTNQVQILQDVRITRIALIQSLGIIQISLAQTVKDARTIRVNSITIILFKRNFLTVQITVLRSVMRRAAVLFVRHHLYFTPRLMVPLTIPHHRQIETRFTTDIHIVSAGGSHLIIGATICANRVDCSSRTITVKIVLSFTDILLRRKTAFRIAGFLVDNRFSIIAIITGNRKGTILHGEGIDQCLIDAQTAVTGCSTRSGMPFKLAEITIGTDEQSFRILIAAQDQYCHRHYIHVPNHDRQHVLLRSTPG